MVPRDGSSVPLREAAAGREDRGMGTDTANVLVEAARSAGSAPSVANSQPWHWRVRGDTLELWAEPSRQLTMADPEGRLLTLSCGAALHHARVALAAGGWQADITRMPDPQRTDLLATLTVTDRIPVSQEAVALQPADGERRGGIAEDHRRDTGCGRG
jgi:hypothetical protein